MSAESRQTALDFWFDFDNQTLFQRTPEITAAFVNSYGNIGLDLDGLVDELRAAVVSGSFPDRFASRIEAGTDGFREFASLQLAIMKNHFPLETEMGRLVYEHFGEGVLYDERRAAFTEHIIHMMDGTPLDWVGYHRWHAFVCAARLSGADEDIWRKIISWIALAWAIQSEMNPKLDDPTNPEMPPERLAQLRARWLGADDDFINTAFVHFRGAAPTEAELPVPSRDLLAASALDEAGFSFARVQQILNDASGTGQPNHGGKRRFWNLPYADFMVLPPIYGVQVIASEGPDRGARSGLVLALKGEPPFGPGGFPRMPLNRPPVTPDNILYIQSWIDAGCPE